MSANKGKSMPWRKGGKKATAAYACHLLGHRPNPAWPEEFIPLPNGDLYIGTVCGFCGVLFFMQKGKVSDIVGPSGGLIKAGG